MPNTALIKTDGKTRRSRNPAKTAAPPGFQTSRLFQETQIHLPRCCRSLPVAVGHRQRDRVASCAKVVVTAGGVGADLGAVTLPDILSDWRAAGATIARKTYQHTTVHFDREAKRAAIIG